MNRIQLFTGLVTAVALTIMPTSSLARQDRSITASEKVPVADLDLSRPADVKHLRWRIRRAARHICVTTRGPTPLSTWALQRRCIRAALASAEPQFEALVTRRRGVDAAQAAPAGA